MSDFFELPRTKPANPIETLEMKALALETVKKSERLEKPAETLENPKEFICFSENDEISQRNCENEEKLSEITEKSQKNASNFEEETHHESVRNEPLKKTLEIIEENLEKIKQEATKKQGETEKKQGNLAKNKQISKKIQNIIDFGEAELGEVGEWVERTANCEKNSENSREDSDFDEVFTESHRENQGKTEKMERKSKGNGENVGKIEKFGLGGDKKNTGKGGYMVNNLKDKAKSMQLAQGVKTNNEKTKENMNENEKNFNENNINEHNFNENNANENNINENYDINNKNFNENKRKMIGFHEEEKNLIGEKEPEHYNNNDWEEISKRNLEHLNQSNIRIHTEEDV